MEIWKMSQLQRDAVRLRAQLDALNGQIVGLDAMLAEAQSFEGHYSERLAAAERRIGEVAQLYAADTPFVVQKGDHNEYERRVSERQAIERERDAERAARTTTEQSGPHRLTFCELDPHDVSVRRRQTITVRDQIARDLADVEAQLSLGQLVESGVPAPDLIEHQQRLAAGRERVLGGAA